MHNKPLLLFHINIRSLLPKLEQLTDFLVDKNVSILALSETWLNRDISDNLLSIQGYNLIRIDRDGRGGGVALYIKDSLKNMS